MKKQRECRKQVTGYISASLAHDCIACWECVDACPRNVFGKVNFLWHRHVKIVASDRCIGCGKCVKICPKSIFSLEKRV